MSALTNCCNRVLVTGGAGFIGSHLVKELARTGNEVIVLDNLSSGFEVNVVRDKSVHLTIGDVRDPDVVGPLVKDADLVYHLAEYIPNTQGFGAGHVVKYSMDNPLTEFDVSCKGTITVLEQIRKYSKKLIFTSTAAVYGESKANCSTESDAKLPISPYGASKLCAETYVELYHRIYGLPTVTVRFFNVYGPNQRKYVMYDILQKLSRDPNKLNVLGTGCEERDFIYVDDAVSALVFLSDAKGAIGESINIGSGTALSLRELIDIMLEELSLRPVVTFTNSSWKGNVNRLCCDNSKLKNIGFVPKYTLQTGLRLFIAWFNASEKIS